MKHSKILMTLVVLAMLLTMCPVMADTSQVYAATGWQPKPNRSVSSAGAFPVTLNDGDILQINGNIDYTAPSGKSPITVASGAKAKIIINGNVTLHGADAVDTAGATAAINVPEGASLTIYSAHDEELSTSTDAPKDTLTVTGGNAAAGGNGENAKKETTKGPTQYVPMLDKWYAGAGGYGGGGAAAAIGGHGGYGGGGGAECSKAENDNDNTSKGGAGGAGGAAGASGSAGSAGTQTGTSGHGLNDARPGEGGKGGNGVTGLGYDLAYRIDVQPIQMAQKWQVLSPKGGAGGTEKDNDYNGGNGGNSGRPAQKTNWHSRGNLIISTAVNADFSSQTGYSYGDGQGASVVEGDVWAPDQTSKDCMSITPDVIYDMMDCSFSLNLDSYKYKAAQCKPYVSACRYDASSDRDGKLVGESRNIGSGSYTVSGYGENIHCKTGTVTITGNSDSSRATVTNDGACIGSNVREFPINKADLTAAVTSDRQSMYEGQSVSLSLGTYTSSTAGSGSLKDLLRESTGKADGPKVEWSVTQGQGSFSGSGLDVKFTPESSGTVKVRAKLTDMNDFNDYTTTEVSLSIQQRESFTANLSQNTPHPKKEITVEIPDGVGNAGYQWYADGKEISGATKASYTPVNGDIGKKLSVKVTPDANSRYAETTVEADNPVEDHKYSANGFCGVCDEYEPAVLSGDTYEIGNSGQMFWFAALVNGDKTHAEFDAGNTSAGGKLTSDIDLENREWQPICNFAGSFDGASRTVSNLKITETDSNSGFFGTLTGGSIENVTLKGQMTLSGGGERVGGAVGYANGGTISGVISEVNISNSDGEYKHVGGVVGSVGSTRTDITKCLFKGSIDLTNSSECIGGVVAYANGGAQISHCANLGTVRADERNAYVGGVLGYMNNTGVGVKNSYSYGKVQNGGGSYCGAIVGWLKSHSAGKITDNCYLDTSAPAAFGSGSNGTSAKAPAKDSGAFESGEACYTVNGGSDADSVIWRQDVDNGNEPYDIYPVFEGDIVHRNQSHDCTADSYIYHYSNSVKEEDHVNHDYENGFCLCCDNRQAAWSEDGVYQIDNGGKLYWFAEQINSGSITRNSSAAIIGNIDLEGSDDGQKAGYDGIVKDRNFPCIGVMSSSYQGSFDGGGHTLSDLYIQIENSSSGVVVGIGLFGYIENADISDFTLKGEITLTGDGERVGGAVGYANGGTISGVISEVNISNSAGECKHVGGVVGSVENAQTDITKCLFKGSIDLTNSGDCIGGVVAYANNGAQISYCANLGTVTADEPDAYVGGVLGYMNNTGASVKNSYSYGKIQNGGGNHCGAIVGWLRSHSAANITDNCYLDTSAPAAFGSGSDGTSAKAPSKTAAQFRSGEACYLVNSKTSTGNQALWKQDIDNGKTPYDIYPVFDADAVYFRSDDTYSNYPENISVNISWGAMEFEYNAGRWDPDTHTYSGGWTATAADGNDIAVQNNSNVAVGVQFKFAPEQSFIAYDLTGTFNGGVEGRTNRMNAGGSNLSTELNLKSRNPENLKNSGNKEQVGNITISIISVGGGS